MILGGNDLDVGPHDGVLEASGVAAPEVVVERQLRDLREFGSQLTSHSTQRPGSVT